jgi:hypothetical protein
VAFLRQRWNIRYLGNEPGFEQLYLAHPEHGPALRMVDFDNYVVARSLSTAFQAGAGGAVRQHRCLHLRIGGREAIVPLPFVQEGDYSYPLELLPGDLVLCRISTPHGERALITQLHAEF